MSDHVTCGLRLWGIATHEQIDQLAGLMSAHHDVGKEWFISELRDGQTGPLTWPFQIEGVRNGLMDKAVQEWLFASGLGFLWENGPFYDGGSGVKLFDPRDMSLFDMMTNGDRIVISADEIANPEAVKEARAAVAYQRETTNLKLCITTSAHDVVNALVTHPELKPFRKTEQEAPG